MIPYFVVLVILAAYGIHRYTLVYNSITNIAISPRPAARRLRVAEGYHTASDLQRALRDRAPGRLRRAV